MNPLLEHLTRISSKPKRLAIGLMSGTSVDGVDAALVELQGKGNDTKIKLLAFETFPFPRDTRQQIFQAFEGDTALICQLNFKLGRVFGECAAALAFQQGIELKDVDFIASHGQTLYHIPPGTDQVASTLQIGDGDVIAERTRCLTISDFRTADMAAGGDGAPLVPFIDQLLLTVKGMRRGVINIGGISNMTVVDGIDPSNNFAFDIGPGNMLMDAIANHINPAVSFDKNGDMAALGTVDRDLLVELIAHEYFEREPPKTTGRELFGKQFAQALIKVTPPENMLNLLATVTALTAKSISNAIADHAIPRGGSIQEVLLCGGGVHNKFLLQKLADAMPDIPIKLTDDYGLPADAKEAMAFAALGNQTIYGLPGNMPRATGASRPVVLGKISTAVR